MTRPILIEESRFVMGLETLRADIIRSQILCSMCWLCLGRRGPWLFSVELEQKLIAKDCFVR